MATRVQSYIITKEKSRKDFALMVDLCHKSKNLYNVVNYIIRHAFIGQHDKIEEYKDLIQNEKFISEFALSGRMVKLKQPNYRVLKAQCSQQVIKQVNVAWKSFFAALRSYKKNKGKFKKVPKMPRYKEKDGMNVVTFPNQSISFDKKKHWLKIDRKTAIKSVKFEGLFKQVVVIPQTGCFKILVIYDKKENSFVKFAKQNNKKTNSAAMDIGVDNLATVTSDIPGLCPLIVNGRPVKSINQFYNKKVAEFKSLYAKQKKKTGKKLQKLCLKRKMKIEDYFHKASKRLLEYFVKNNIGTVFIGHNNGWKQEVNIGKVNNQNFVQIPFDRFIKMIQYKSEEVGIQVVVLEEAYTSKCSALDWETIEKHETYMGKRVKRGLFKTKNGQLMNADVNGSLNILRLGLISSFEISSSVFNPVRMMNINEICDVFRNGN